MEKIIYGVKNNNLLQGKGVNRMIPSKKFRVFHFLNMEYLFCKNSLSCTQLMFSSVTTETEDIKKRWQEYIEELYKKRPS